MDKNDNVLNDFSTKEARFTLITHQLKLMIVVMFAFFHAASYAAEQINVVVGLAKPPYVFEKNNEGYELELVSHILNKINKTPNFIFVPFGRSPKMFTADDIDAILTSNKQLMHGSDMLSDTYITYQNVAISLKENNFQLKRISDLRNYSIASFQSAHKILGEEFAIASVYSPMYTQVNNQKKQLELLMKKRVDVIIIDINIAQYYLNLLTETSLKDSVKIHTIFPPSEYSLAFKDKSMIKPFNHALKSFKNSKTYIELKNKYNYNLQ